MPTATKNSSKEFAFRLKHAAGEAGIYSARELARLLDLQEQSVKQWYNGNARPNGKNLANLLALLHVNSDWLMHGRTQSEKPAAPPVENLDPDGDFRAALAVISGMAGLLSKRTADIAPGDAIKIGRTIHKAAKNAERAFQALAGLDSHQSKK